MSDAFNLTLAEDRLLPWKRVRELTGLSRTTVWLRQKAGDFPAPVVISPGRVGWRESEIAAWAGSLNRRRPDPDGARAAPPAHEPRQTGQVPPAATRSADATAATARGSRRAPRAPRSRTSNQIHFDF